MPKRRLTSELVSRGFFTSEDEAERSILAGDVYTSDRLLTHPGEAVDVSLELHVREKKSFVSRGGIKLEAALDTFEIDAAGLRCLDVGASSGGFTHCLLSRGAAHVCAVDVGYAQFDWALRQDGRVCLLERCDIKDYPARGDAEQFDLVVCDASFTSIVDILPAMESCMKATGELLCLVKPQFEADKDEVGEGGIVRDKLVHLKCLSRVAEAFGRFRLGPCGASVSAIKGHKGNVEFFMYGRQGAGELGLDLEACALQGKSQLIVG